MWLFLFPFSPIVIFTRYFSSFSFNDFTISMAMPFFIFFAYLPQTFHPLFPSPVSPIFSFPSFYHHFICHIFIYFFRRYFFISFIVFMVLSSSFTILPFTFCIIHLSPFLRHLHVSTSFPHYPIYIYNNSLHFSLYL